jgi:hypothetical protein
MKSSAKYRFSVTRVDDERLIVLHSLLELTSKYRLLDLLL